MIKRVFAVVASFAITFALLSFIFTGQGEAPSVKYSSNSSLESSGQLLPGPSSTGSRAVASQGQSTARQAPQDLKVRNDGTESSDVQSAGLGAERAYETVRQRMNRLGRPLDGSEYAFVRYKFSLEGVEEILADSGLNPGAQSVSEETRTRIVSAIKERRPLADALRKERRKIERIVMMNMLETGEVEKATVVDGKYEVPRARSPEERIHAFGANGRTGYIRWKPGMSEERDSILYQECMIFADIEREVAVILATRG